VAGAFASEWVFDLRQLATPLGRYPPGILVWRAGHRLPAHVPVDPHRLAQAAIARTRQPRTIAVALHTGGDADSARLPLAFAAHLDARRRAADPRPVRPCATAAGMPELPRSGRLVRLPHLLTVQDGSGDLRDEVVWEVMTTAQARRWLGGPLPDQALFEQRLPALRYLRRLARTRSWPDTANGRRLRELLAEQYLSIRLVYRYPALFTALTEASPQPDPP
jgi:hypothetical protein